MSEKRVSYLSQLRFDKRLLSTLQAKYLANIRLPILLILSIVILGVSAFISIPRRLNPEINIPIVVVSTVLPGASPDDVEQLLTVPLEKSLASVDNVDTMTSTSRENVSVISLQFTSGVDVKKAENDVKSIVDTVTDLPEDAKDSHVQSVDFEDQPVWTFAVSTQEDAASLMRFSDKVKKRLELVSKVDRVLVSGFDEQSIEVVIDPEKIRAYGVGPLQIAQVVKNAAQSFPAGNVRSDNSSFSLTINREITSLEDVRNIQIPVNNIPVRLGDIATVGFRSKSGQHSSYLAYQNKVARQTVQFFVFKKKNANIDAAFHDAEPVVNKTVKEYDNRFSILTIQNTAKDITKQFDDLFGEFQTTVLLVFILLFLFLGLRQAIISSLTVPLTFLTAFAVIKAMGLTLNFLTMFSFLLSLGLLIDDTIVSVAAMTRYYRTGRFTAYETGLMVWRDFIVPLWSTTITTIWAFVPLLLSTGIIGEFIKSIPIVVTITMLASTSIAVLITIPLMIVFLKPELPHRVKILGWVIGAVLLVIFFVTILPKNALLPLSIIAAFITCVVIVATRTQLMKGYRAYIKQHKVLYTLSEKAARAVDHGVVNIESISLRYRRVIERILTSRRGRRRTLTAVVTFAIIAYLLVPFGFVKNEFFPKDDAELLYISVLMPSGTGSDLTTKEAVKILNSARSIKEVNYAVAEVGQAFSSDGGRDADPASILVTLHLTNKDDREETSSDVAEVAREKFKNYTAGKLSVVELSGGPPAGADVQIKLIGEDLGVLDSYAQKIVTFLEKQPGVTNVDKSIKSGTSKVVFTPDKARVIAAGLTVDQIGLWMRTYSSGFDLKSVRLGDDEEDVVFRTNSYDDQTLVDLSRLEIPTPSGSSVPLLALGTLQLQTNPTIITREDEKRTLSVFGAVTQGYSISDKNNDLLKFANSLDLPEGYSIATGGVNEENQKSVNSILQAMVISFLLILITMVIEFGSFRQALMAMLIIPISIAGVFYIFALTRTPLSFAALIGVLALFGIVVTHAIVVIEKINENRAHGMPLKEAISDAAANRLEPVLLTSVATILGLTPITIADPFWRGLGGAIIAGLLFSGALKLFFIPVLYYNWFSTQEDKKREMK